MDYSSGIILKESCQHGKIKVTQKHQPTGKTQGVKWCWCVSTKHLHITFNDFPVCIDMRKSRILALEMGISQYEANMSEEGAAEKGGYILTAEADWLSPGEVSESVKMESSI